MTRLRLRPEGPFALATSIRFPEGFTPAAYQSEYDQTLDLAFPVDDDWRPAPARVSAATATRAEIVIAHLPGRRRALERVSHNSHASPQTRNSSKGGIMTQTDRQTVHAQAAFDRRGILDDVKARLSAISGTLSDSRIDVGQLRKDVAELTAITGRIAWLADISTPRGGW